MLYFIIFVEIYFINYMKTNYLRASIVAFIIGFTVVSCGNSKRNTDDSESTCKTTKDYQNGYNAGKGEAKNKADGLDYSANSYVYLDACNNGEGMVGSVSRCWHDGFADGFKENNK